jgi:hypothetical protein
MATFRAGDLVYAWSPTGEVLLYNHLEMMKVSGKVPVTTPVFLVRQERMSVWSALVNGESVFIYTADLSMACDAHRQHLPIKNL